LTTRDEIAGQIRAFLLEEFPDQGVELTDTTSLLDDWMIDSVGIVSTVLFLESHFDIEIARADLNGTTFATIDALANLVASRLASK